MSMLEAATTTLGTLVEQPPIATEGRVRSPVHMEDAQRTSHTLRTAE